MNTLCPPKSHHRNHQFFCGTETNDQHSLSHEKSQHDLSIMIHYKVSCQGENNNLTWKPGGNVKLKRKVSEIMFHPVHSQIKTERNECAGHCGGDSREACASSFCCNFKEYFTGEWAFLSLLPSCDQSVVLLSCYGEVTLFYCCFLHQPIKQVDYLYMWRTDCR